MELLTLQQHRDRIANIRYAEEHVKGYLQRIRVHDYIPGQVIYNLGEYPAGFSIQPTEYDYNLIKKLAEKGVGLIQLHEEWNDGIRKLGADKFSSHDPAGLKAFIRLCHDFGIKVIPYVSTGFFDVRDPDFKENFTRNKVALNGAHYRYRLCNAASPEWNTYVMQKIAGILDEYEFDGLYNDMGYDGEEVAPENWGNWPEEIPYNPYWEDMLARVYSLVKEKGGIYKIHQGACLRPNTKEKIYDYLWVGECVESSEAILRTAAFDPYVIVCPDYRFMEGKDGESLFAKTLPFMQFVLRVDGRPVTGERIAVPGVDYVIDKETVFYQKVWEYHKAHPEGPHVYSEWSTIPDDVKQRADWFKYLDLYKPMVKENSVAFVDISENTIVQGKLPKDVHMSLFINEKRYLCMSNLGEKTAKIEMRECWHDRQTDTTVKTVQLQPGSICFLESTEANIWIN